MSSVLQEWVAECCSWKEQTLMLTGLRGTDANVSEDIKAWTRWIRRTVLNNAAPAKKFMRDVPLRTLADIAEHDQSKIDMLPVHFYTHLMHTLEVISLRHPDVLIMQRAAQGYADLVAYLHLQPEFHGDMIRRLSDEM